MLPRILSSLRTAKKFLDDRSIRVKFSKKGNLKFSDSRM